MIGVHKREQQADCYRLDAGVSQIQEDPPSRLLVELSHDRPVICHPLRNVHPQTTGDQRRRLLLSEAVELWPLLRPDFQHVTEALRRQQGRPCPFVLKQRVGRDRRPVHKEIDGLRRKASGLGNPKHPFDKCNRLIGWCRRRLLDPDFARFPVEQAEIREGAPHIDAELPHCVFPLLQN